MTKEQFLMMIKDYQEQDAVIDRVSDILNWDSPIIDYGWKMMDLVITTNFNEIQQDWINWWLFDRMSPYGNRVNKAYNENREEIDVSTPEKLWDFIQRYN